MNRPIPDPAWDYQIATREMGSLKAAPLKVGEPTSNDVGCPFLEARTPDYAQIWHRLQESKAQLEQLLAYMAEVENADDSSDETIKQRLDEIGQQLNSARRLIDS